MTIALWAASALLAFTAGIHFTSIALAIPRCRKQRLPLPAPDNAPRVSLIRPACGLENHIEATLRSTFDLDYPHYEIIFCVAVAHDPVVPLIRQLMADYPHIAAHLLIGDERIGQNPKLNNVYKGWRAAAHDWIVIADSNVLMPHDYIQRLLGAWRADTGLVCSPPIGRHPAGFWAELECAFLNGYQARFQYAADSVGFGFAQGKTMLWHRRLLQQAGGIRALSAEPAEDAAATKVVRGSGLRVRLVDAPFAQLLGRRNAGEVWRRQVRWARLRRASFMLLFMPEILSGGLAPIAAAAFLASATDAPFAGVLAVAVLWYGGEAILVRTAGWHLTARSPVLWILRDVLLPVLWIQGWIGNSFVWRGNAMRTAPSKGLI